MRAPHAAAELPLPGGSVRFGSPGLPGRVPCQQPQGGRQLVPELEQGPCRLPVALLVHEVEAERILIATQSALDQDPDLLSADERAVIDAQIAIVRETAQGDDHQQIKDAVAALAKGTEDFAARRMDRSVRAVLAGKKLDEVA